MSLYPDWLVPVIPTYDTGKVIDFKVSAAAVATFTLVKGSISFKVVAAT